MLSITKSKKDHPLLQHNGYSYRLDRLNENTGQRTWRCSKKSCSGRATTAGWDSALTLVKVSKRLLYHKTSVSRIFDLSELDYAIELLRTPPSVCHFYNNILLIYLHTCADHRRAPGSPAESRCLSGRGSDCCGQGESQDNRLSTANDDCASYQWPNKF